MFKNNRQIHLLIVILSLSLLFSCENTSNVLSPKPNTSISDAIRLWQSWNIHNYSLGQQWNCVFYPWCGDSAQMVIREDTIVSITLVATKMPLDKSLWGRYKTVNQLFELVLLDTSYYDISYVFNTTYGFPEMVSYQPKPPIYTEGGFVHYTYELILP